MSVSRHNPLPESAGSSSRKYWPAILIVATGSLLLCMVQFGNRSATGKPLLDFMLVLGAINLGLYFWLRVWSKFSNKKQSVCAAVVLLFQLAIYLSVRLDGFDGNGRFIAKWRWTPTPEQRLSGFEEDADFEQRVDLSKTTPFDTPSFRGVARDGDYRLEGVLNWQQPIREVWRRPIGRGWSSFAVVNGFAVTQEQIEQQECVSCYEVATGRLVWRRGIQARFDEVTSGTGPRATPTICDGRVFALGATGNLCCLDGASGEKIWSEQLCDQQDGQILFGFSCSPLIHEGRVFVALGSPSPSLMAFDARTGEKVWSSGDRKAGYSSPHLFESEVTGSVLLFDAIGLHSHSLEDGGLEWTFAWGDDSTEQVNVAQPVVVDNKTILISSGYGRGSALIKVNDRQVTEVWRSKRLKSKFSSVIVDEGYAYGLDQGILTCIDIATGKRVWKGGRYGHGQFIKLGNDLIVQRESGGFAVVEASPNQWVEVARFQALSDRTWNHPVVYGKFLLARNDREAVCFELPIVNKADVGDGGL